MITRLTLAVLTCMALGACTTKAVQYEGVAFHQTARNISTTFFLPNGDLYLVPEKGAVVDDVLHSDGSPMAWRTQGSYVVLPAQSIRGVASVILVVNGKHRHQPISEQDL